MTAANIRDNPHIVECRISLKDPPRGPIVYPPSSRTIARLKAKGEEATRNAEATHALAKRVQPLLRPPVGRLFAVDAAALLLRGPMGGIGTSDRIVCTLAPLVTSGRHAAAVLAAAGRWQSEEALREALAGVGGKLNVIGLRICRRRVGYRMARCRAA